MKTFDDVLDLMARDHYDMTMFIVKWKELLSETPQDVEFRFFDNTVHYVPNFAKLRSNEMFEMFLRKSGGEMDLNAEIRFPAKRAKFNGVTTDVYAYLNSGEFGIGRGGSASREQAHTKIDGNVVNVYRGHTGTDDSESTRITPGEVVFRNKSQILCNGKNITVEYDLGLSLWLNDRNEVYLEATRTWIKNAGEKTGVAKSLLALPMNRVCGVWAGL